MLINIICIIICQATVFQLITGYTWLRSGSNAESYIAWYMSAAGYKYSLRACTKQAVRPATHKAVGLSTTKTSSCHPEQREGS